MTKARLSVAERRWCRLYRQVKKHSSIPIWGFGAVWLIWGLVGPLYRPWHLLLCAACSALAYVVLRLKFPPKAVEIEREPDTGDKALDDAIREARTSLRRMRSLGSEIPDPGVCTQLAEIESLGGRILAELEASPDKLPQLRRFLNYYLPTTLGLLERYARLRKSGEGENVKLAMERIEQLLGQVAVAFRRQLDALFASETMDITADIAVMEQMLRASGLTDETDFKS